MHASYFRSRSCHKMWLTLPRCPLCALCMGMFCVSMRALFKKPISTPRSGPRRHTAPPATRPPPRPRAPRAPDHESEPPAGRWNLECETVEKNGRNREARTHMLLDHITRTWFRVPFGLQRAVLPAWSLSFPARATATPPMVNLGPASPSLYPATRPCLAWASPFHSPFTVHGRAMPL